MSTRTPSSKPGNGTLKSSGVSVWPTDTIERTILEQDIHVVDIHINKELDLLIVVLSTSDVLRVPLSTYTKLKKARAGELQNWQLIGNGYGVHWPDLDEHLSLKGFLRDAMMSEFLHQWRVLARVRTIREKARVAR